MNFEPNKQLQKECASSITVLYSLYKVFPVAQCTLCHYRQSFSIGLVTIVER
jgi:hypothetical protein